MDGGAWIGRLWDIIRIRDIARHVWIEILSCHEKLFPSSHNSRRSVEEVLLDNENYDKLREDFDDLTKQKIRLEQDLESFKEDKRDWACQKDVDNER